MTDELQAEPHCIAQPGVVGIIGTGLMGTAVGLRLLEQGYSLKIWNRNQDEPQQLLHAGAVWSENPLRECSRVIICLYNSPVVLQVISGMLPDMPAGTIAIDMTTGEPADADRFARLFDDRQAFYLASPVSGSSHQTRLGEAMVMVGGNRQAFEACQDLWTALTNRVHFTGSNSSASKMKLITNLVLGLNRAALAEALAFAEALNVDPRAALQVLQDSAAASAVMATKGEKMVTADFSVQARLNQHLKDVNIILALAASLSLDLPLSAAHKRLLELAQTLGYGEQDNSAILRAYQAEKK
ncbi:MAG: NAD(P)-dependent oxidoreductase [Pirellulales bacterium]